MVVCRPAELGLLGLGGLLLLLLLLGLGEEVLVAAETGAGELLLVLLAHLPDLGEVHGVVRHRAVLHVPVPERRHRHPRVHPRRPLSLHAPEISKLQGEKRITQKRNSWRFVHGKAR